MKVLQQSIAFYLMFIGMVVLLFAIWIPSFVLTGDGPCHLYNAKILTELWTDGSSSFFSTYFFINPRLSPNWLGHIIIAPLVYLFDAEIAEKLFLSIYVFLFLYGWYLFIKEVNNKQTYLIGMVFLFVLTEPLFKGFYNFSLSLALFSWVLWSWIRFWKHKSMYHLLLIAIFSVLILFSHPIGYLFATCLGLAIAAGTDVIFYSRKMIFKELFKTLLGWILVNIPLLLFLFNFSISIDNRTIDFKLNDHFFHFLQMTSFFNVIQTERSLLYFMGISIITTFLFLNLYRMAKGERLTISDFVLLSLLFTAFYYFYFPENFGCDLMEMRVQIILYFTIICYIIYFPLAENIKKVITAICFTVFLILMYIRIPIMIQIGQAAREIYTSGIYIKPHTKVLPLSFNHNGLDVKGKALSDGWVFPHAAQYIGVDKEILFMDNYEAHMEYFPLHWYDRQNPYINLFGNFEDQNPDADLVIYEKNSGAVIHYILLWCYDPIKQQNPNVRHLFSQIDTMFHPIYLSPSKRVALYQRN